MTPSFMSLAGLCIILAFVQLAATLPWMLAFDIRQRPLWKKWSTWGIGILACAGVGLVAGWYLDTSADEIFLARVGRVYASILHLQLAADLFVGVFALLLIFWPKGGAVALSAFREGIRQPMFWLLGGIAFLLIGASPFVPYFTFGEDLKMVKELGYALTMLAAAAFAVIAASMSVSEEIEGRTAVTLMSKPVSRRQFLLGKFGGILMAALFMTAFLGWFLVWVVLFGSGYIRLPGQQDPPDPQWVVDLSKNLFPASSAADLVRGMLLWTDDVVLMLPGLVIGFCQAMVFLAISLALATRLPVVVNWSICLAVYYLGHLTPILSEVSRTGSNAANRLVFFIAQLFDTLLPGLDLFDVGTAVIREAPLPPLEYNLYAFNVSLYAVVYTAIALLFGLILFEDRDLA
jgi:ABC-type transport system involved in multi-copper enzyme maturation permease subunit